MPQRRGFILERFIKFLDGNNINRINKGVLRMELCSLCQRIKEIRIEQGNPYYNDLCDDCKEREMKRVFINMGKRMGSQKSPSERTVLS